VRRLAHRTAATGNTIMDASIARLESVEKETAAAFKPSATGREVFSLSLLEAIKSGAAAARRVGGSERW
jgi:hypothetical protein